MLETSQFHGKRKEKIKGVGTKGDVLEVGHSSPKS